MSSRERSRDSDALNFFLAVVLRVLFESVALDFHPLKMPKVTTLANKENIVPLSKTSRKTKVSLRDDDDHDEVIRLGDIKRSKSNTTASSSQQVRSGSKSSREAIDSDPRQHASSSGDSEYARRKKEVALSEGEDDDDKHERKSRRERMLEEKLALVSLSFVAVSNARLMKR
jgi:hypothetical protein